MSPPPAASSPKPRLLLAIALLFSLPKLALAESPSWVFWRAPQPARSERLRRVIAAELGAVEFEPVRAAEQRGPSLASERLAPLRKIETALAHARAQAALLAEDEALSELADAARIGAELGDIEGAAAWNAEIQLGIGVTAAQAGLPALAEGAFRIALTLDPARRLLEAEAAPTVLALYERVQREAALAPNGQVEVRASAPNASVFLDDVALGPAPVRFHAPVGRHILRVAAPGHRVYGTWIDVLEGERPPLVVQLAPSRELETARALDAAAVRSDYASIANTLRSAPPGGYARSGVVVVEAARSLTRALLVRCERKGCRAPLKIDNAQRGVAPRARSAREDPLTAERLAQARTWLEARTADTSTNGSKGTQLWQRWYFWGALAAVAVAGTAFGLAARSERVQRFRVVIEQGDIRQ